MTKVAKTKKVKKTSTYIYTPMKPIFREVSEFVRTHKGKYIVDVFKDGYSDDIYSVKGYFLYVKVLNNKVVAFIEINNNDKIVAYSGTANRIEMIKKRFEWIKG